VVFYENTRGYCLFVFCELTGIPKFQKKLISLKYYFITKI